MSVFARKKPNKTQPLNVPDTDCGSGDDDIRTDTCSECSSLSDDVSLLPCSKAIHPLARVPRSSLFRTPLSRPHTVAARYDHFRRRIGVGVTPRRARTTLVTSRRHLPAAAARASAYSCRVSNVVSTSSDSMPPSSARRRLFLERNPQLRPRVLGLGVAKRARHLRSTLANGKANGDSPYGQSISNFLSGARTFRCNFSIYICTCISLSAVSFLFRTLQCSVGASY